MSTIPPPLRSAIVLLSGGLDSTTCLAIAINEGFDVHAVSFQYGQRHAYELDRAREIAHRYRVASHSIVNIDLGAFAGSALTSSAIEVPKSDSVEQIGGDIPVTYVPARNTVFLAMALGIAESRRANDIFIGVNALDYSGYPDCRPEFIKAFEQMANLATKHSTQDRQVIRIRTPLIDLTKAEIVKKGLELGVDYSKTISCYDPGPGGIPCGRCDACLLRSKGFAENGMKDPSQP